MGSVQPGQTVSVGQGLGIDSNPAAYTVVVTIRVDEIGNITKSIQVSAATPTPSPTAIANTPTPTPTPSPTATPNYSFTASSTSLGNDKYTLSITNTGNQPESYVLEPEDYKDYNNVSVGPVSSGLVPAGDVWTSTVTLSPDHTPGAPWIAITAYDSAGDGVYNGDINVETGKA
jgi:hypothetical protein